jgi:hypothetical protein
MSADTHGSTRRAPDPRVSALAVFVGAVLGLFVACTPRQEGELPVDVEPERIVNTDLVFPKNTRRWAYVSSRVSTDARDPFPGYHVVLANPFVAQLREEGKTADRGIKLAQFVYEPKTDASGTVPGELRRVNLLVRDPDRYRTTGGWGFASYDGTGRPIAIEPATDCISCHPTGPVTAYFPKP